MDPNQNPQQNNQPGVTPQPIQPPTQQPPAMASFQNQQNVQYVVMQQSLEGHGGWLMFFMIIFGLNALTYFGYFFGLLSSGLDEASAIVLTILAPLLALSYLASVVCLAMQKKIAKFIVFGTLGLSFIYTTVANVSSPDNDGDPAKLASFIVASLIMHSLLAL